MEGNGCHGIHNCEYFAARKRQAEIDIHGYLEENLSLHRHLVVCERKKDLLKKRRVSHGYRQAC